MTQIKTSNRSSRRQASNALFQRLKIGRVFGALLSSIVLIVLFNNCSNAAIEGLAQEETIQSAYSLQLEFTRVDSPGLSPFDVTVHLMKEGKYFKGQTLELDIPAGTVSEVTENPNGTYNFRVTPSGSGVYPVTVKFQTESVKREAIVAQRYGTMVGQPLLVSGMVNTEGYEDGATITPDGQYLFVQYGPLYFSGLFLFSSICKSLDFSVGFDILGCSGKDDADWVFKTIGPTLAPLRPDFPTGAIEQGKLTHIKLIDPGNLNGIPLFPTTFYGFKRQNDGTFAQPFKVGFNDPKGANGPFGLSFVMTTPTTAKFAVAWNNYFNNLGDEDPDIYAGTLTFGTSNNLGNVTYSGEDFQSITPNISPISFDTHAGQQGNPHLFYDSHGVVKSIWVDDEKLTHGLSVYKLTSDAFPSGTWVRESLPSKINTIAHVSQPFFTGSRLYLTRDTQLVYHDYIGSGHTDYGLDSAWGDEVVLLKSGDLGVGSIFGFGEPTIATMGDKKYLYFVVVRSRAAGIVAGRYDYNLDVGFVEIK
ncbi:MAG: hypothetical protein JNM39_01910 [Bdellovibrionaceae bacterium]|nr:hypothetical protein [Pseudobdellovibrionaceae bacterium]